MMERGAGAGVTFCPSCGERAEDGAVACPRCGAGALLDGRYRLVRPIARHDVAGTATWQAERVDDGQLVAIKRCADREADRDDQAMVQSTHPRLATVHEVLRVGGSRWRVQEWIDGPDLQDAGALRRPGLPEDEVLQLLEEVAEGLEHLHGLSPPVVHGDLKPVNVRRGPHGAVLVDHGASGRTSAYVSPEQRHGRAPSPRSDLFALGMVGMALLTGEDPSRLLEAGAHGRPRWRAKAAVRAETRRLVDRLVDPDPSERPASARAVRESIRAIVDGEWATVPVRPVTAGPNLSGWGSPQDVGWLAVGASAVIGMHVTVGVLLVLATLLLDRLGLSTVVATRLGAVWLATLPLSQLVYVGPAFGLAWQAQRASGVQGRTGALAQGVALGAAVSVALYLGAGLATLLRAGGG